MNRRAMGLVAVLALACGGGGETGNSSPPTEASEPAPRFESSGTAETPGTLNPVAVQELDQAFEDLQASNDSLREGLGQAEAVMETLRAELPELVAPMRELLEDCERDPACAPEDAAELREDLRDLEASCAEAGVDCSG